VPRPGQHETELYLSVLATIGVAPAGLEPEYRVSTDALDRTRTLLSDTHMPLVVIHPGGAVNPGTSMPEKRWPAISYGELATALVNDLDASVVLVGSDTDREATQIAKDFADAPVLDLSGQLSIGDLAAVAQQADLYVGNDSGMSHLACAVGTPTVTIFGPTSPRRYRPLGANAFICAPDASRRQSADGRDLRRLQPVDPSLDISLVSLDEVFEACRRALQTSRVAEQR
jgi:heptosyltransferase-2/heptosyltransferase-3